MTGEATNILAHGRCAVKMLKSIKLATANTERSNAFLARRIHSFQSTFLAGAAPAQNEWGEQNEKN